MTEFSIFFLLRKAATKACVVDERTRSKPSSTSLALRSSVSKYISYRLTKSIFSKQILHGVAAMASAACDTCEMNRMPRVTSTKICLHLLHVPATTDVAKTIMNFTMGNSNKLRLQIIVTILRISQNEDYYKISVEDNQLLQFLNGRGVPRVMRLLIGIVKASFPKQPTCSVLFYVLSAPRDIYVAKTNNQRLHIAFKLFQQ